MTDGEGPSSSLLGKRPRLHEEADEERRKKKELLEEIAASLLQGLSNQRKKQSRHRGVMGCRLCQNSTAMFTNHGDV